MPHTNIRKPAVAAVVVLLLACLGLVACGGSSSNTTSSSTNAAVTGTASGTSTTGSTSTTPGAPGSGRGSARFAAMRECLQKNGITLPKRTPGGGFVPGAGAGGGPQLPGGVTRAQYEAALKKCGGGSGHFFRGGTARRLDNPALKAALAKYGDCLRENGIKLPAPNTSGNGPIFNTKGINTSSSQFKTASTKCRSALTGAFRRPTGTPGAAGSSPAGGSAASGQTSTG